MAYISASKSPLLKPTVFSNLSRLSTTHFKSLRLFSSESSLESLQETPDQQPPIPQTDTQNEESVAVADANPNPNPNPILLAKQFYEKLKREPMSSSREEERPSRFMYNVARAEARLLNPETKGDPDGAKTYFELFANFLEALLMRGHHVEEVLGRFDRLNCIGREPDFDSLLSVLSEKGKTIAAVKLVDFCLERDYNVDFSSYDKVLDALLADGKTLDAYSILCKIKEKGGVTDQSICKELIKILNEEGNTKQADILSRMFMGKEKGVGGSKKGKK